MSIEESRSWPLVTQCLDSAEIIRVTTRPYARTIYTTQRRYVHQMYTSWIHGAVAVRTHICVPEHVFGLETRELPQNVQTESKVRSLDFQPRLSLVTWSLTILRLTEFVQTHSSSFMGVGTSRCLTNYDNLCRILVGGSNKFG